MGGRRECTPRAAFQGRIALESELTRATDSMPRWLYSRILHSTAIATTPKRLPMTRHRPIRKVAQTPGNHPQNQSQSPKSTQRPSQFKACLAIGKNRAVRISHDHHRSAILVNFRRKSPFFRHFPLQRQVKHPPATITLRDPVDQGRTKSAVGIVKQGPAHAAILSAQHRSTRPDHTKNKRILTTDCAD